MHHQDDCADVGEIDIIPEVRVLGVGIDDVAPGSPLVIDRIGISRPMSSAPRPESKSQVANPVRPMPVARISASPI